MAPKRRHKAQYKKVRMVYARPAHLLFFHRSRFVGGALKAWIEVDNKAAEVFASDPAKEYVEKMGGDWAKVAWNSARAAA